MKIVQFAAFAVTLLTGGLVDKTTGQPLSGVDVRAQSATTTLHTRTDTGGHFALRRLPAGRYLVTVSSDDVPPQHFHVVVGGKTQRLDLSACSTTLDYSCAQALQDGGS